MLTKQKVSHVPISKSSILCVIALSLGKLAGSDERAQIADLTLSRQAISAGTNSGFWILHAHS